MQIPFFLFFSIVISFNLFFCSASIAGNKEEIRSPVMIQAYRYYKGLGQPVNYPKALRLYLQAANGGNVEAAFIVGGMYFKGQGTDPNQREGFKWLLKAERQGKFSPESLAIIGSMYLQGTGVPQNYQEARKYLQQAADLGELSAKKNLAFMYYNGLVGKVDYSRALELYTEAALQGDNAAQNNVGLMYVNGLGADVDRVQAYAWYSLAASQGNAGSMVARNNLMIHMSWEELNRAQALSVKLFEEVETTRELLPATP
jgi:TPR repeat protein